MKEVAELDQELTIEERNLLSVAYKNIIVRFAFPLVVLIFHFRLGVVLGHYMALGLCLSFLLCLDESSARRGLALSHGGAYMQDEAFERSASLQQERLSR